MDRLAVYQVLLFAFMATGHTQPASPQKAESETLGIRAWKVPPGFVTSADPSDPNGARKSRSDFKRTNDSAVVQYDAREFLENEGISFDRGEAIYDQATGMLIVRNTPENLEILDAIMGGCGLGYYSNVMLQISTYQCILPAGNADEPKSWPTYSEIKRLPTADVTLLDSVSAMTRSGNRINMSHVTFSGTRASAPSSVEMDADALDAFQDGEFGTIADAESVIGPDGTSVDCTVSYRFRMPIKGNEVSEVRFMTSFSGWENYPVVIHVSPVPGQPNKFVVVTGNVQAVNPGGWKLPTADKPKADS